MDEWPEVVKAAIHIMDGSEEAKAIIRHAEHMEKRAQVAEARVAKLERERDAMRRDRDNLYTMLQGIRHNMDQRLREWDTARANEEKR